MVIYLHTYVKEVYNINIVSFQKEYIRRKSSPLEHHSRKISKKKNNSFFIIPIAIIFISSFLTIHNLYITTNCEDLYFSVEYNFTSGLTQNNKLMRVQYMNLISKEDNSAIVEVFGLSKSEPHGSTTLKGKFIKDNSGVWTLQSIES